MSELQADQVAAQEELDAVGEYLQQLKKQCQGFIGPGDTSYEERQAHLKKAYQERERRRKLEEAGLREALQVLGAMNQRSASEASGWKIAVRLSGGGAKVEQNIGQELFNRLFAQCPVVRYLRDGTV